MRTFVSTRPARATILIPTYGHAPFVRWAVASAQAQTVRDIEICVICDGSPPDIVEMLHEMKAEDNRIQLWGFPKAPRTGEIHRAVVISRTTGKIICYLSHDDLWYPNHVEILERALRDADFAHTLHVEARLGDELRLVRHISLADISKSEYRERMLNTSVSLNYFGLTYGAHTRDAYVDLEEGWTVTPEGEFTDLYMWRKFLRSPGKRYATAFVITALHFPRAWWEDAFSMQEFDKELGRCFARLKDPAFREEISNQALEKAFSQLEASRSSFEALNASFEALNASFEALKSSFEALLSSKSWRLTRPLRWLSKTALSIENRR